MWKPLTLGLATVLLCAPAAQAFVPVSPDVQRLDMHIGGRTLVVNDEASHRTGWEYQWPGIYFEARFTGTQVSLRFDDSANIFNVIVDGREVMQIDRPGQREISLTLPIDGPHTIRLEKRSETQHATGIFYGFYAASRVKTAPAPTHARQIEFIGDSLTAGYGNTSAFGDCTAEDIFETTDTQRAFGPLIAKHYDADYRIEAYSGAGLVRNSVNHDPALHVTELYPRAVLDDPAPDTSPWSPQIVVVNLGGNDFNAALRPGEKWGDLPALVFDYRTSYVAFVKALRARYPKAEILLSTTTDKISFLPATVDQVFADLKADGVTGIDRINWPAMQRTGCDKHPNVRDDATIAKLYVDYIDAHPALWQGH